MTTGIDDEETSQLQIERGRADDAALSKKVSEVIVHRAIFVFVRSTVHGPQIRVVGPRDLFLMTFSERFLFDVGSFLNPFRNIF